MKQQKTKIIVIVGVVILITIILIGIVAAVAYPLITGVMNDTSAKSQCISNGGVWNQSAGRCD